MVGRIRSIGWVGRNESLIFVALAFFITNQLIEALVIYASGARYDALCNWDCGWYRSVVEAGYDLEPHGHEKGDAANWAFFPAVPLAARLVGFLLGTNGGIALVVTSKLFFLLSVFAFLKFAKAYRPGIDPLVAASVVALNPYSIYGNVGYTESLFLLLTCTFFYLLKRGNHIAAGIAGAFLTSSRVVGLFAFVSYLCALWRDRPRDARAYERALLGALLIPLGLASFMIFLYQLNGDALAFSHIQRAWGRMPGNPFSYMISGLRGNPLEKYMVVLSGFALLVPVYFAWKKNFELAFFSLCCTLIPLATGPWSMPRYIAWQAPMLLALTLMLTRRIARVIFIALSVTVLTYFNFSWLAGKGFLV